jgi:ArsR family transcriptional regulator
MTVENIFKCLSDPERIRILCLLHEGSLCVCHVQEILGVSQVKASKQFAYLKKMGLVESVREANWMVYKLVTPVHEVLEDNLRLLSRCECLRRRTEADMARKAAILQRISDKQISAPEPVRRQCCGAESNPSGDCCAPLS